MTSRYMLGFGCKHHSSWLQVNYVGPYMLTRLLEPCLSAAGQARVVNVSSVTHRYGEIGNPATFLSRSRAHTGGAYPVRLPPWIVSRATDWLYRTDTCNALVSLKDG